MAEKSHTVSWFLQTGSWVEKAKQEFVSAKTFSWVYSQKLFVVEQNGRKCGPSGLLSQHTYSKYGQKKLNRKLDQLRRKFGHMSEMVCRSAKWTQMWVLELYIQHTHAKYGRKSQTGSWFCQTGNWVESQKWCIVERKRQQFGPSGLYLQYTYAKYGQKSQTWSWFCQTGSWVVS